MSCEKLAIVVDSSFSKIEIIKTIGATFMAASGLQIDENDQNPFGKISILI